MSNDWTLIWTNKYVLNSSSLVLKIDWLNMRLDQLQIKQKRIKWCLFIYFYLILNKNQN